MVNVLVSEVDLKSYFDGEGDGLNFRFESLDDAQSLIAMSVRAGYYVCIYQLKKDT